jgi:hypothetical protein
MTGSTKQSREIQEDWIASSLRSSHDDDLAPHAEIAFAELT